MKPRQDLQGSPLKSVTIARTSPRIPCCSQRTHSTLPHAEHSVTRGDRPIQGPVSPLPVTWHFSRPPRVALPSCSGVGIASPGAFTRGLPPGGSVRFLTSHFRRSPLVQRRRHRVARGLYPRASARRLSAFSHFSLPSLAPRAAASASRRQGPLPAGFRPAAQRVFLRLTSAFLHSP
ncbi:MAG: hypothetical protein RLZZ436_693 [Planctomycetota bacterium]